MQVRFVVYPHFLQIADYRTQHGGQIRSEQQVRESGVGLWVLGQRQEAEVDHFVVEYVLSGRFSALPWAAFDYFANADDIGVVEPRYFIEF